VGLGCAARLPSGSARSGLAAASFVVALVVVQGDERVRRSAEGRGQLDLVSDGEVADVETGRDDDSEARGAAVVLVILAVVVLALERERSRLVGRRGGERRDGAFQFDGVRLADLRDVVLVKLSVLREAHLQADYVSAPEVPVPRRHVHVEGAAAGEPSLSVPSGDLRNS